MIVTLTSQFGVSQSFTLNEDGSYEFPDLDGQDLQSDLEMMTITSQPEPWRQVLGFVQDWCTARRIGVEVEGSPDPIFEEGVVY